MDFNDFNSGVIFTCISTKIESGEKKKAQKPLDVKYNITALKYYVENFFPIALKIGGKSEKENNHTQEHEKLVLVFFCCETYRV